MLCSCYRLLNWKRLRALGCPYFLRSTMRLSRVSKPCSLRRECIPSFTPSIARARASGSSGATTSASSSYTYSANVKSSYGNVYGTVVPTASSGVSTTAVLKSAGCEEPSLYHHRTSTVPSLYPHCTLTVPGMTEARLTYPEPPRLSSP